MLTKEEVIRIAHLARLELSEEEISRYQTCLGNVLEHIKELESLGGLSSLGEENLTQHVPSDAVAFREDRAISFERTQEILANAPKIEDQQFAVPVVVEKGE